MIEPFIAALGGASAVLFSRQVLYKHKLGFKEYLSVGFLLNCLIMLPFFPWANNLSYAMLSPRLLLYMLGIVATAFTYNYLYFKGFAHERLTETESLMLFVQLFAIGFAYLFFPSERQFVPVLMGLIATLVLLWAHVTKGHLKFTRNSLYIMLSVVFFGLEYVFMKELLIVYNPYTLYFARCLMLAIVFSVYFGLRYHAVKPKNYLPLLATQASYVVQFIAIFWSVENNGIVLTNIVLNLTPVLVFAYAYLFYKDHPGWKKMLAGSVILACIVVAQLYR